MGRWRFARSVSWFLSALGISSAGLCATLTVDVHGGADFSDIQSALDPADADDSGDLEITDAIYSLAFQFLGGPSPVRPFLGCGIDPSLHELDCESYSECK